MREARTASDEDAAKAAETGSVAGAMVEDTGTVEVAAQAGDVIVALPPSVYAVVQRIAGLRGTTPEKTISDALALQEAVTVEKNSGARLLIERHGDVEELAG